MSNPATRFIAQGNRLYLLFLLLFSVRIMLLCCNDCKLIIFFSKFNVIFFKKMFYTLFFIHMYGYIWIVWQYYNNYDYGELNSQLKVVLQIACRKVNPERLLVCSCWCLRMRATDDSRFGGFWSAVIWRSAGDTTLQWHGNAAKQTTRLH